MSSPWNIEVSGPKESPTLVFLHGFMGCAQDWQEVVEVLTSSFRCVTLDLPFHGKHSRPHPSLASFEGFAQGLHDALLAFHLVPAVFVGYSMGGRLALTYVQRFPDDCRALVIESASPGLPDPREREMRYEQDCGLAARLESTLHENDFAAFLDEWYRQPIFPTWAADTAQRTAMVESRLRHNHPRSLADALRAYSLGRQPPYWEALRQWAFPMLWIAGERDKKYSEITRKVIHVARNSQSWIAPNVGHTVHAENAVGYTLRVQEFLHAVVSPARPPAG